MRLRVVRHLRYFLSAEVAVNEKLPGVGLLVGDHPEVVDEKIGRRELPSGLENPRACRLMDAAGEIDIRIMAKQTDVFMVNIGRVTPRRGIRRMIRDGRAVPDFLRET